MNDQLSMQYRTKFLSSHIGLFSILVLTVMVYKVGMNGPFVMDDYWNIVRNDTLRIDNLSLDSLKSAAFSRESGILMRPISMATFALNFYVSGEGSSAFKWTNLIIHLISGVLVFAFSYGLLIAWRIQVRKNFEDRTIAITALFIAGLWLLHPLNVSSVLYIVQRMALLSTLFMLCGLTLYVYARLRLLDEDKANFLYPAGIIISFLLAVFSKENGALLIPLILMLELLVFRFKAKTVSVEMKLRYVTWMIITLCLVASILFVLDRLGSFFGYAGRDFTMMERILSQCRIVTGYLQQIILPDISTMGLTQDDFVKSTGILSPPETLYSMLFLALIFLSAVITSGKFRLFSACVLFFFIGHSLESTFLPLELIFEHRNYLPMIGILILTVTTIMLRFKLIYRYVSLSLLLIFFSSQTYSLAYDWSRIDRFYLGNYQKHPDSVRANLGIAAFYQLALKNNGGDSEDLINKIRFHYLKAYELNPKVGGALIRLLSFYWQHELEVESKWIEALANSFVDSKYLYYQRGEFKTLVKCEINRECKFGRVFMENLFADMLATNYSTATIHNRMARYYNSIDEKKLAYKYARKATPRGTEDVRWLLLRAELAMQLQQYDDARIAYDQAVIQDRFAVHRNKLDNFRHQWQEYL